MKKAIVKFLATGTYTGLSPAAPGTVGTLWGVVIAWFTAPAPPLVQALVITVVFAASVYLSGEESRNHGRHDPGHIVCDEVAGVLVAFFLIPFSWLNAIIVFILFRLFDILKPWPVGALDKRIKGGLGITVDDIAAGVYANICAQVTLWFLA